MKFTLIHKTTTTTNLRIKYLEYRPLVYQRQNILDIAKRKLKS